MSRIEAETEIAGHIFLIQDNELMVFIPGEEGNSEPLSKRAVEKLAFLSGMAQIIYEERQK